MAYTEWEMNPLSFLPPILWFLCMIVSNSGIAHVGVAKEYKGGIDFLG